MEFQNSQEINIFLFTLFVTYKMVRLKTEERVRICTLLDEVLYTPSELAKEYKVSVSTITRLYEKFKKNGSTKDLPRKGRPRSLNIREERRTVRYITSGECTNAVQVTKKLQEHDIEVCPETVRRVFKKNNLKSAVKIKKPLLLPRHKKARHEFAKKYKDWDNNDWAKVVWSDESKFNLYGSDGRQYCWKRKGESLKDQHVKGTVKFGGGGIFVWGCFTSKGIGNLCRIDGGLDAALYCQILEEDFLGTLEYYDLDLEDVVFQQDNDPKHTARITKSWMEENGVVLLEWPAQSPDLNPIEHMWNEIDRRLRNDNDKTPIRNKNDLWEKIQSTWNDIEVDVCTKLIETMPRRIKDVLDQKGGYTRW